jgi:hypothetical protein
MKGNATSLNHEEHEERRSGEDEEGAGETPLY